MPGPSRRQARIRIARRATRSNRLPLPALPPAMTSGVRRLAVFGAFVFVKSEDLTLFLKPIRDATLIESSQL